MWILKMKAYNDFFLLLKDRRASVCARANSFPNRTSILAS